MKSLAVAFFFCRKTALAVSFGFSQLKSFCEEAFQFKAKRGHFIDSGYTAAASIRAWWVRTAPFPSSPQAQLGTRPRMILAKASIRK